MVIPDTGSLPRVRTARRDSLLLPHLADPSLVLAAASRLHSSANCPVIVYYGCRSVGVHVCAIAEEMIEVATDRWWRCGISIQRAA